MPEGSEFHTEGAAKTAGSKDCVDSRNWQWIGVGRA